MKVINLGAARDLMFDWEEVRQHMLKAKVRGACVCLQDQFGKEAIYLCGTYKSEPQAALKAAMKMSVALTMANDEPLDFQRSRL